MDLFLVPVGQDRHELYCEAPVEPPLAGSPRGRPSGWWRRQVDRFSDLLAQAEEEGRRRDRGEPVESRGLWRWIMRKIAESIAQQRLLWHLRRVDRVHLIHPADVTASRTLELAREALRREYDKHRRWFVIDGAIMVLCLPLTVIPGPNVPSIYFTFRAIGHYLSMRGARRGTTDLLWTTEASAPLASLRQVLQLPGQDRRSQVADIGERLGLDRLSAFVDRLAS
jgi:K+-H+ exchange-related protein